jgi:UDP:flavonoid glycosyltransferase YjiC (YdhE family)
MVPEVETLGWTAFATGSDVGLTPRRLPLVPVDLDREIEAVGSGFGRRIARERAADLLPLCAAWRPDLVVCEELDFGAMIVAERLALPHATVLVTATGSLIQPCVVVEPLNEVRAEHGLAPDPDLAMPGRHLVLSPFAPSYRDPGSPLPTTAHAFRPAFAASNQSPPWLVRLGDAKVVYFTLGTVFNAESGDLFQRVIAGLRDLSVQVAVTVGRGIDPAELGPQPANVHVERYVSQGVLLPRCHLVVCHAGSGSVMGALAHGLPMVLFPLGADQPLNAARCQALGVARVLNAMEATPAAVGAVVSSVLEDPSYRRESERLRDEIAALPGPAHAVVLLERLAQAKR